MKAKKPDSQTIKALLEKKCLCFHIKKPESRQCILGVAWGHHTGKGHTGDALVWGNNIGPLSLKGLTQTHLTSNNIYSNSFKSTKLLTFQYLKQIFFMSLK